MKQRPRRTHASETSYSNVVSYEAPSHSRVMMPCPRLWSVSSALAGDPLVGRRPRSKPRVGDASFQPSRLLASPTKTSWARNSPWPRSWCFSNCNSRAKHDKNRRCKINNCKPRATDQIVCLILRCAEKDARTCGGRGPSRSGAWGGAEGWGSESTPSARAQEARPRDEAPPLGGSAALARSKYSPASRWIESGAH